MPIFIFSTPNGVASSVRLRALGHPLGGVVVDEPHQVDAVAHPSPQQAPDRRAERLAGRVPQSHLDRGDRELVVRQRLVQALLEARDVARVVADDRGPQVADDVGDHADGGLAVRGVVDADLPVADEAVVADDLDQDGHRVRVAAIGRREGRAARDAEDAGAHVTDLHGRTSDGAATPLASPGVRSRGPVPIAAVGRVEPGTGGHEPSDLEVDRFACGASNDAVSLRPVRAVVDS